MRAFFPSSKGQHQRASDRLLTFSAQSAYPPASAAVRAAGRHQLPPMDTLEFLVQGSSPLPYRVAFRRRNGGNLSAYCTCPAGENGMYCKHRVHIMRGSVEGIVSDNHGDVTTVTGWVSELISRLLCALLSTLSLRRSESKRI